MVTDREDRDPADTHTLVAAYALDAVDEVERAAVERHLAACLSCRDEVEGLRATAVRLADAGAVTPPAGLRAHVLAEIAITAQARAGRAVDLGTLRPRAALGARRHVWGAAAAVLAVIALAAGSVALTEYRAAQDAQATAARVAAVLTDPAAHRIQAVPRGGGLTTLVVAANGTVLAGSEMPSLAEGRTFQLWIIRRKHATSAGLGPGGPAAGRSWSRLIDGVTPGDVIAVTVEPAGGSSQPTSSPVVALPA